LDRHVNLNIPVRPFQENVVYNKNNFGTD